MYFNNILETIGNTPLVKLNRVIAGISATVLAKVETFNPGNSIKDRIAVKMIEDAEKAGLIKPGGTIIEGTSGNTGMGLAIACIVKGYKLICTMPDKQSKEKMDILRAMGAEVVVTPTNVSADDPRSYYSVAKKLNREIANSYYPNQYDNLSNSIAHYEQTGPEIWKQPEGKITHLVVGTGTGGSVSGTGKYLKEKNPAIKIWAIDTFGSALKKFHETGVLDDSEIYSYLTEGIGEDIIPKNVDFKIIDHFEKVSDKDGMLMTRELARKEGIFVGNSAGCAIAGLLQLKNQLQATDLVVVIFHDHGSRYVGKIFNDDWMRERGFLEKPRATAQTILSNRKNFNLISIEAEQKSEEALKKISGSNISQMPVIKNGKVVGSISESGLFSRLIDDASLKSKPVEVIMEKPFPMVPLEMTLEEISAELNKAGGAVMVKDSLGFLQIITKHDLIQAIV